MTVYLAHTYGMRAYLRERVVPLVEAAGHSVTSAWIWDDTRGPGGDMSRDQAAAADLADLEKASTFLMFTAFTSRGKHIELGYAVRAGKRIILVGEDQTSSVFYYLPNIRHAADIEAAIPLI